MKVIGRALVLASLFGLSWHHALANSQVDTLVAKKAAILASMHKKAKKALVNSAQDEAFHEYFVSHEAGRRHELKKRIDRISLTVQSRFEVEEMCLIAPNGSEISRIVGDKIALDLSHEEASAPFFAPGFAQKPRTTYVSPIYMSPDADRWVLAYTTPIASEGHVHAILHYEHGLDSFQQALSRGLEGDDVFVLAVNDDGWVVSDSRQPIEIERLEGAEEPGGYFQQFVVGGYSITDALKMIDSGADLLHGENGAQFRAAYRKIHHWTLIAFQRV